MPCILAINLESLDIREFYRLENSIVKIRQLQSKKSCKPLRTMPSNPRIVGIGLVALDLLWSVNPEIEFFAGGTCGNVLAILSYLGWKARPIARIGDDIAGNLVRDDLRRWGTDIKYLSLRPVAKTPVIVEKIRSDRNGIPFHTFSFYCPSCSRRFPGFQPVTAKGIEPVKRVVAEADVLFIDRVSKSSLILAEIASSAGITIVFEPPNVNESKSFARILEIADIVKYSHDRIDELPRSHSQTGRLDIQTLGRGGLRFRSPGEANWQHLQAEPIEKLVDAAGSGDWLTAGFLYSLCRTANGINKNLKKDLKQESLVRALTVGQKLAAWNCSFRGARGGMYTESKSRIAAIISESFALRSRHQLVIRERNDEPKAAQQVCLNCSGSRVDSVGPALVERVAIVASRMH